MKCPFCEIEDFDKIGLKNHLERDCYEYHSTISIEEERIQRLQEEDIKSEVK
jgi:hypothetical protein